jgi:hypothetical protein
MEATAITGKIWECRYFRLYHWNISIKLTLIAALPHFSRNRPKMDRSFLRVSEGDFFKDVFFLYIYSMLLAAPTYSGDVIVHTVPTVYTSIIHEIQTPYNVLSKDGKSFPISPANMGNWCWL